jgi:outer membrane protein assembly factor BamC
MAKDDFRLEGFVNMRNFASSALVLALGVSLVTGCSGTIEQHIDKVLPKREATYKNSRSLPPLEVPPDLSSTTLNDSLRVPESASGSATLSQYNNASQQQVGTAANSAVLPSLQNVRVARRDDKRWLVVSAPPAQVWPRVRDFWLEQGFLLKTEDASIGIMETDWAEKREGIKGGFISGILAKLSNTFYGVSTRDKYRTRLERATDVGETEVFISHRGAEEMITEGAATSPNDEGSRSWQPIPADSELEAEMLSRMMVFFGVAQDSARTRVADTRARPDRASLKRDGGGSVLRLQEQFSRAWRRTGLALDRVGFTVEDRDRSRGLYFVRYVDSEFGLRAKGEKGFFSKLAFWDSDDDKRDTSKDGYLVSLVGGRNGDEATQVVVLNKEGERDDSPIADRILTLLHEQLK